VRVHAAFMLALQTGVMNWRQIPPMAVMVFVFAAVAVDDDAGLRNTLAGLALLCFAVTVGMLYLQNFRAVDAAEQKPRPQ